MSNPFPLGNFGQDLRFGLRLLIKSPAFALVAILTLAVGIGANTAIFSVVNAVLLKPLPYPDANRLAILWTGLGNTSRAPASLYEVFQIRQRSRLFDQIGGIWVTNASLPGDGEPEQVKAGEVTANFLSMMCSKPELGRLFRAEDESPNSGWAVVISHGVWARRFGSDPEIIGKAIRMGGGSLTVVGVLPENFRLIFPDDSSVPTNVELFFPVQEDYSRPGGPSFLRLIGHLRPGASFAQAQAEADSIAGQLRGMDQHFHESNLRLFVFSLQGDDVRSLRPALLLLFGGVGFVLLTACANVAHLLLANAASRERELTVRAALGAAPSRIIRQLLTEGIALGILSGAAGIAIGWTGLQALLRLRPEPLARLGSIQLDLSVLGFTFAISVLTSLLFALAPAVGASRVNPAAKLKETARTMALAGPRNWLIAGEVCMGFTLLAGTGLLFRTFVNVLRVDPGFRAENVLSFQVSGTKYDFLHQLQQNLQALPGSESASLVSHLPLDDSYPNWYDYYWREGAPTEKQNTALADHRSILPGYFRTIGASLIEGRDFTDSDDAAHAHVAIVDEVVARELWPGEDALGKKLNVSDSPGGPYQFQRDWAIVVGIVRHVQYHSLTAMVRPQIYVPYPLAPRPVAFVLRTSALLAGLAASVRAEVHKLNKDAAVGRIRPLADYVIEARSQNRFLTYLAGTLSAIALFLACIGIFGVTSHGVSERRREIGIRMAVGASGGDIQKLVLRQGIAPVVWGLMAGLALSLALTPLMGSLLFGVKPGDPASLALTFAFLLASGALAAYFPAHRATRLDPLESLRCE